MSSLHELRRRSPPVSVEAKQRQAPPWSLRFWIHSRAWILWRLMCFSSCRRRLTSAPYLPTVPSSTRRKWECRLLRTFSLLRGFSSVWYGAIICGVDKRGKTRTCAAAPNKHRQKSQKRLLWSYVSANEVIPVFNDSPGCDPDSANFLWWPWTVLFESISHVLCYTFEKDALNHFITSWTVCTDFIASQPSQNTWLQILTDNIMKVNLSVLGFISDQWRGPDNHTCEKWKPRHETLVTRRPHTGAAHSRHISPGGCCEPQHSTNRSHGFSSNLWAKRPSQLARVPERH